MDDDAVTAGGPRRPRPLGRRWTAPTPRCCATSRSPRRGSATRAPRRSPPPSASRSRAASRDADRNAAPRRGAAARRLAGLAAGAGCDYHEPTRARTEGCPCDRSSSPPPWRSPPSRPPPRTWLRPSPRRPESPAGPVLAVQRRRARGAARRDPRLPARQPRAPDGDDRSSSRRSSRPTQRRGPTRTSSPPTRAEIFDDGFSFVGGNPEGSLTIVEFLDYQCGFCRRAQPEVQRAPRRRRRHPAGSSRRCRSSAPAPSSPPAPRSRR